MNAIDYEHEAQIHRETYIGILKSLLKPRGDKERFAQRIGITPQYLSFLLDVDDRTPSPAVAERMAAALPIDPESREFVREQMLLANKRRVEARRAALQESRDLSIAEAVGEFRVAYSKVLGDPSNGSPVRLRAVRNQGWRLAREHLLRAEGFSGVRLYSRLQHLESLLHRPYQALYSALHARTIMQTLDPTLYGRQREEFDYL